MKAWQSLPSGSLPRTEATASSHQTTLFGNSFSEALAKPTKTAFSSYENALFRILGSKDKTKTGFLVPHESPAIPTEVFAFWKRKDGVFTTLFGSTLSEALAKPRKTEFSSYDGNTTIFFKVLLAFLYKARASVAILS